MYSSCRASRAGGDHILRLFRVSKVELAYLEGSPRKRISREERKSACGCLCGMSAVPVLGSAGNPGEFFLVLCY